MLKTSERQGTLVNSAHDEYLFTWLEAFLIARKAQGVSDGTLHFYRVKLKTFSAYCEAQAITQVHQITPLVLREYLLWLEEQGHNPGGRHAHYRAIRTFLYFYEDEAEPDNWKNPIKKVSAPKVPREPLEPVSWAAVDKLLKTCRPGEFTGDRDAAILLVLLDTGLRAGELLAVNLEDVNQVRGDILVRKGKGGKPRTVFMGKKTRRAVRRYLKHRTDTNPALWVTHPRHGSERFEYFGLRSMLVRRAGKANIEPPTLHDFRRAFALAMLRQGVDIYTLAKLMGHEGIDVLKHYLKQTTQDTREAHRRAGVVDNGRI